MTRTLIAFACLLLVTSTTATAVAELPTRAVSLTNGKTVTVSGNLFQGSTVDLKWATSSQVACFPANLNDHYDGRHMLFTTDLPPESVLEIEAIPTKSDVDISLYAYTMGTTNSYLPPNVPTTVSCESSQGTNKRSERYNPGGSEKVTLNAIRNPYKVVIGVAGAQKLDKGAFQLKLTLVTKAAATTGTVTKATAITLQKGKTATVTGKLDGGAQIDLDFAQKSQTACFVGTQFTHFDGNHVAYIVDLPKQSNLDIKATPTDKSLDISLYAYSMGTTNNYLPPNVPSAVSCEASFGTNKYSEPYNPGGAEDVKLNAISNPYKVVIVVAGAQKVTKGAFKLEVTLTDR